MAPEPTKKTFRFAIFLWNSNPKTAIWLSYLELIGLQDSSVLAYFSSSGSDSKESNWPTSPLMSALMYLMPFEWVNSLISSCFSSGVSVVTTTWKEETDSGVNSETIEIGTYELSSESLANEASALDFPMSDSVRKNWADKSVSETGVGS
ncbi:hypothetical protein OGAPHI_004497 [Ogataea philodendri]|uniref:Uncharacterized protein n=1 Tax=Ogataea philodendri TaxID=1378263 RepID=A0A9P8P5Q8_9ASCO|nr:uncharacterized protein OGAPHI_004497 [Ogataea philodendri]KAH3666308.1 hypothetical protein OGAPHI_004497 [Ogataea philodendri]